MGNGRRAAAAWGLGLLAAANGAIVTSLWWRAGGAREVADTASALVSAGRLTGLLGAYLALVVILLMARIPALDRLVGLDRLVVWHRRLGQACLTLLLAHAGLIVTGYATADDLSLPAEAGRLLTGYPGVMTAAAGLVLLVGTVASSVVIARRRLRRETWYFVHLYTYLAIALAFSHQLATGQEFVGDPLARAYWTGLYVATLAAVLGLRLVWPVARSLRHRLHVERVLELAPGVVTLEIGGVRLDRLGARAGQCFGWRFLTRDRWWEVHPFSLSEAPDGRRLRITVKALGDFTGRMAGIAPGTRVIVEGPYGGFLAAGRRRPRVAMIAGGVGITPIRALLETLPGGPGDIAVLYRAESADQVVLRDELDALAGERSADLHYVLGDHRDPAARDLLSPAHLRRLLPDIAARDVYLCGPPGMTDATRTSLRAAGVPRRRISVERFEL